MRLSAYILRTRALGEDKVPSHMVDGIGEMIAGGAELSALLKKRSANLSARHILGLWRASARLNDHLKAVDTVMAARRDAKEKPLTPALLKQTISDHEIDVLQRVELMAVPGGKVAEHRRRDAIKEAIALWNACLALSRREGKVLLEGDFELPEDCTLQDVTPVQWVAIRTSDDIKISLELPMERFIEQVSKRGAELSAVSAGMDAAGLLGALVLGHVEAWAFKLKDEEARLLAARAAGNQYLAAMTADPVSFPLAAGIWVDGDEGAVAIVDSDGQIQERGTTKLGDAPGAAVEALFGSLAVEAVILPEASETESAQLAALRAHFEASEAFQVIETNAAGALAQAGDDSRESAALIVAQRAIKPMDTWAAADPLALGLVPYPAFLKTDDIRGALDEMRALALAGVKPEELAKQASKRSAPRAAAKPLNPTLKSVDDLRPGMEVNGLVTNITQFGAFVNIGLSHEGLIHVSELADHFVNDPKEVVAIGQAVKARVLGVDRGRRRISLSLRPDQSATRPDQVRPSGGVRLDDIPGGRGGNNRRSGFGGDRPRQHISGTDRKQALRELENLFKKE